MIISYSYGTPIVVRTVTKGKIRWASCAFTIIDTPTQIAFYCPKERNCCKVSKGTRIIGRRDREIALREELLTGKWDLVDHKPNPTSRLVLSSPEQWFSVFLRPEGVSGNYVPYYVNFERPHHRTQIGFDADDLCLDLKFSTFLNSWEVKDLLDYQERVELGIYSIEEQDAIRNAKDHVMSLIQEGRAPFDGSWENWRPETNWKDYPLPPDWDNVS